MTKTRDRDQEYRRELLTTVGPIIHGPRWIAPLAADIASVTGRAIKGPAISHYLSGLRPFPEWIESAMLQVINNRIAAIIHEGTQLRAQTSLLQLRLTMAFAASANREPEPEPEPEPDDAPSPGMM